MAEGRALREVIALQEAVGLDVLTDGEFRRYHRFATIPAREEIGVYCKTRGVESLLLPQACIALL